MKSRDREDEPEPREREYDAGTNGSAVKGRWPL